MAASTTGSAMSASALKGGHWDKGQFFYNRAVTNVSDTHITNVYNKTVVNNVTVDKVSYNGGNGGTKERPTAHELAVEHQSHVAATSAQVQHQSEASKNKQLFAYVNHGSPAIAATSKPGAFYGSGVVTTHSAAQAAHTEQRPAPKSTPAPERSGARTQPPPMRALSPLLARVKLAGRHARSRVRRRPRRSVRTWPAAAPSSPNGKPSGSSPRGKNAKRKGLSSICSA